MISFCQIIWTNQFQPRRAHFCVIKTSNNIIIIQSMDSLPKLSFIQGWAVGTVGIEWSERLSECRVRLRWPYHPHSHPATNVSFGIDENVLDWIVSYVTGRRQTHPSTASQKSRVWCHLSSAPLAWHLWEFVSTFKLCLLTLSYLLLLTIWCKSVAYVIFE